MTGGNIWIRYSISMRCLRVRAVCVPREQSVSQAGSPPHSRFLQCNWNGMQMLRVTAIDRRMHYRMKKMSTARIFSQSPLLFHCMTCSTCESIQILMIFISPAARRPWRSEKVKIFFFLLSLGFASQRHADAAEIQFFKLISLLKIEVHMHSDRWEKIFHSQGNDNPDGTVSVV